MNSANEAGGIDNRGTLTISDSTFHGNSPIFNRGDAHGGGIISGGATTISNSTFSGNSAQGIGSFGGGIYGNATLQNSIVANSPSGGNCYGTMTVWYAAKTLWKTHRRAQHARQRRRAKGF